MRTGKILGALAALAGFAQDAKALDLRAIHRGFVPIPGTGGVRFTDIPRAKPLPMWARDRMTERYTITNKFAGGAVHVESVPAPTEAIAGTNLRRERRAARWAKSSRGSGTPPSHIAPWVSVG